MRAGHAAHACEFRRASISFSVCAGRKTGANVDGAAASAASGPEASREAGWFAWASISSISEKHGRSWRQHSSGASVSDTPSPSSSPSSPADVSMPIAYEVFGIVRVEVSVMLVSGLGESSS